jgi:hypothetical protein
MQLSSFAIVRERDDAALFLDDPLIHCFAGNQIRPSVRQSGGTHGLFPSAG